MSYLNHFRSGQARLLFVVGLVIAVCSVLAPRVSAQEDFDDYKIRLDAFWFYSNPTGTIQGQGDTVPIDLVKDLNFSSYSTFSGKVDWKFTRKNHFYVAFSPFYTSRQTTLVRTIVFRGQTFVVGSTVQSDLHAFLVAPGYQYDIIRRKRGHLGLGVQFDLFDTTAKISAAAQVVNGVQQGAVTASSSLLAPIPVAGPQFRFYLTDSPRVFVEGNLYGMYFFGYGNFVSTADTIGVTLTKHISVNAGYQLGSRLNVTNKTDRLGISLTQKGALAGVEFSF
jgi:hypothetical protein